jgi:hypothetical protein
MVEMGFMNNGEKLGKFVEMEVMGMAAAARHRHGGDWVVMGTCLGGDDGDLKGWVHGR